MPDHPVSPFLRGVARARRWPLRDLAATIHAGLVLVVVEALVRWVPLPRLARLLGIELDLGPPDPGAPPVMGAELDPSVRRRLRAARRASDMWPFAKGPCLRRSLVAGHLVRHRGAALRIGFGGVGDEVHAHAWLELDGRPLEPVTEFTAFQQPATRASA